MTDRSRIQAERVEEIMMRFEPSIMGILNKNKKICKKGIREKEMKKQNIRKRVSDCPEAPHNTSQYLTHKRKSKDCLSKDGEKEEEIEKHYTIDNFIITGGSMKGIIHNIILFN
jgi:hypothetical protein